MANFRLDNSVSWGDIGMALGLFVTGLIAFTDLSESVSLNTQALVHQQEQTRELRVDLTEQKRSQIAADEAIRAEIKGELRDINQKLDRIIERGK